MRAVALIAFVVGLGLMLPFEHTITRLLGMIAMATFVVAGLLAVASPEFIARDRSED